METKSFKTRTIYEPRQNGQIQGIFPVAIDIGYSAVKVMSPLCVASVPFFAKQYVDRGTIGDLPSDHITYKDLETGETWLVGSHAQLDSTYNDAIESDEALYGRNRYYSPEYKVCARVGIALGMMPNRHGRIGSRKLVIQTGLPPKYAQADSRDLRDVLAGSHHFSVKIGSNAPQEFNFELDSSDINIIMQPMGTLYSAFKDSKNKFSHFSQTELNKNILVFDAGFGTFDLFYISNHSVKNSETFSSLGMKRVFQDTIDKINKKYGVSFSVTDMQKYLESGTVRTFDRRTYSTKDEPFADLLEESSRTVCNLAIEKMTQIYPIHEIDYLIVTGGTGAAWEREIKEVFKNMATLTIISGNQSDTSLSTIFANVRGYYMYRCSSLESTFGPLSFTEPEKKEA